MSLSDREDYRKAAKKLEIVGMLGLTAEDHRAIGSTPSDELAANPGKRMVELMDDEQLLDYLRDQKRRIEEYQTGEHSDNQAVQSLVPTLEERLRLAIKYLKRIGRLPKEAEKWQ